MSTYSDLREGRALRFTAVDCLDEPTVAAFVGGRLVPDRSDGIDDHLASCRACRDLVVAAAKTTFATGSAPPEETDAATPATGLDRYAITGLVGTGGQALVYTARDTVLERTVALKLLRDDRGVRLLEEARLVARLDHPNIVAIYDAGVASDGQLYLAMEHASGGSLETWLRTPRTRAAIVTACLEAGAGLACAHAAGMIHRDIKPANILVGADGHARVADFGLAITGADRRQIAGTLAYMAPEQLAGEATAASDQFALAVTAWEALAGELPFPVTGDRLAAIEAGPAPVRGLPRELEATLRRALAPDPAARWRSVPAFLQALARDPHRLRKRLAIAAGAIALVAGGAVVVARASGSAPACGGAPSSWTPAARARIEHAFAGSPRPYAATTATAVIAALDHYATTWSAARSEACESGAQTALRYECLDERDRALATTIDTLAAADATTIEHAVELARALPAITPCANLAWLRERVPPPIDPLGRVQVAAVTAQTVESTALLRAGNFKGAAAVARRATELPVAHPPTHARALLALARTDLVFGSAAPAEAHLEDAAQTALRGRDDRTAAEAWIELVKAVGHGQARYAEALRYAGFADASISRLGGDRELSARLDYYRCAVFDLMTRLPEADAACARAEKDRTAAFGAESPEVADVLVMVARLALKHGKTEVARTTAARALAIRTTAFGATHPSLIEILFTSGQAAIAAGKLADADAAFARGVEISRVAYDADSLILGALLSEQARLAHARGKLADALALIDRANTIRATLEGPDHADLIFGEVEQGRILDDLGRSREAATAYERALAIATRTLGPAHSSRSAILQDLGRLHGKLGDPVRARRELDQAIEAAGDDPVTLANATAALAEFLHGGGKPREAIPIYQRALAMLETAYGADAPQLVNTLSNLGLAELDVHAHALAVPYLERAIAITKRLGGDTAELETTLASARHEK